MRPTKRVLMIAFLCSAAEVGCTKTQGWTVSRFNPSSLQTNFVQEAPAATVYVVEIDRPGKKFDTRVESTRVSVLKGTTLGFERRESAIFATAGGVRLDLPPIEGDATLSWRGKTQRKTKLAKLMGKVAVGVAKTAAAAAIVYAGLGDDNDVTGDACDGAKHSHRDHDDR